LSACRQQRSDITARLRDWRLATRRNKPNHTHVEVLWNTPSFSLSNAVNMIGYGVYARSANLLALYEEEIGRIHNFPAVSLTVRPLYRNRIGSSV